MLSVLTEMDSERESLRLRSAFVVWNELDMKGWLVDGRSCESGGLDAVMVGAVSWNDCYWCKQNAENSVWEADGAVLIQYNYEGWIWVIIKMD